MIDCEQLPGRKRDICRGYDDAGLPVLTPEKRIAYLRLWEYPEDEIAAHIDAWTPEQASRGLGDTVAKITTKLGIKPCGGCKKRQKVLNKLIPYQINTHDSQ